MKSIFTLLAATAVIISCSGNDDISENPKPTEKTIYNFEYKNYSVKTVILFKGPVANPSYPGESYLATYWDTYQEPTWKKISIDTKNNSLKLISGTSADAAYTIKTSKDSVFIVRNNEAEYIGMFNKAEASFTLKRAFKYVKKVPRNDSPALSISSNTIFGTFQYTTIFGFSAFNTPSEMTEPGDEVLWGNIEYGYHSL